MRVSVQLIDAETANHLWAERFDKPLADLFDMQDQIVARLANTLSAQLSTAEARRAERAPNPDSIDLVFQGVAWLHRGLTPDYVATARRLLERALALDPANVSGLVGVAGADMTIAISFYCEDRAARLATAEEALTNVLSLAPEYAPAHLLVGILHIHTNRASLGIRRCERALELDRNLAHAHAQIGTGKLFLGQAEATEAHVREALRLGPHDTFVYVWCTIAGMAKLWLGKEEQA
jgi:tetratricopeptide (TPR) repeat protein